MSSAATATRAYRPTLAAFSPRTADLTVYLWPQFDHREELLASSGTHSCGKGVPAHQAAR